MPDERQLERLWESDGAGARLARAVLRPLSGVYGVAGRVRGALYDRGILRSHDLALPAIGVGNLSVGGTGKTPVAAWVAAELARRGAVPAVVLRGYGGDEPIVHATLNPGIRVVVAADRVAGAARARFLGADVVVLDDAFQHRRARRLADLVLVSADRWSDRRMLLPAGPWREPLRALERASLAVVTRKAASADEAGEVALAITRASPDVRIARVHLAAGDLRSLTGAQRLSLGALAGASVLAIAAVGDPRAFLRQIGAAGARVRPEIFPDHHPFSPSDAARLARGASSADLVICTLKDAVKLGPRWPREAPPLWYVSQRLHVESGLAFLDQTLERVLAARQAARGSIR